MAAGIVAPPTNPGPFRGGLTYGSAHASFDRQHDAVNPSSVQAVPSTYTVRQGDTLAGIAQATWGDANLWYLLAAANGLGGGETLTAGRLLTIPPRVVNRANRTDTFRPYDPAEALGDVQPNTPTPRPQGRGKKGCGVFGAILLAVVAIAVTAATAGAAPAALGGAVSAAAGSVVSQVVGVATGIQDKFSFAGVALAALSAGVAGGLAQAIPGAIGGSQFLGTVVRGAAGSAITQGVAVATGLQKRFSWAGVAAAGLGAGVSAAVGGALRVDPLSLSADNIGKTLIAGAAGGIANAATRSIVEGSGFGDNLLAALPDVIAGTVGAVVSAGVERARLRRADDEASLAPGARRNQTEAVGKDLLDKGIVTADDIAYARKGYDTVFGRTGNRKDADAIFLSLLEGRAKERQSVGFVSGERRRLSAAETQLLKRAIPKLDLSDKSIILGDGGSTIAAISFRNGHPAVTLGNTIYVDPGLNRRFTNISDLARNSYGINLLVHEGNYLLQYQNFGAAVVISNVIYNGARYGGDGSYQYYRRDLGYRRETFEGQSQIAGDYAQYRETGRLPQYRLNGELFTVPLPYLRDQVRGSGLYGGR